MNWAGCYYAAIMLSFSLCWKTSAALSWSEGAGFRSVEVHPGSSMKNGFTLMDPAATGVAVAKGPRNTGHVGRGGTGTGTGAGSGSGSADEPPTPV